MDAHHQTQLRHDGAYRLSSERLSCGSLGCLLYFAGQAMLLHHDRHAEPSAGQSRADTNTEQKLFLMRIP